MVDISKCANKQCSIREKCYRFTAPANPYWQAYTDFKPNENETCEYYIEKEGYYDSSKKDR